MLSKEEYKKQLESKFGKPLREIIEENCDLFPSEAESVLGVPANCYKYWRNMYRLGPMQREVDIAIEHRKSQMNAIEEELDGIDLGRVFQHSEISVEGLKEIMGRYLELYKKRRLLVNEEDLMNDFTTTIKINGIETMLNYINDYLNGYLKEKYWTDLDNIMIKQNKEY